MVLNSSQKLIVYALSEFYNSLNQPLTEKPVHVRTSKITFIELLETAMIISAHKRALYKNIEFLEQQKYITYRNHMIAFTAKGLKELAKINKEIECYHALKQYFQTIEKPKRKLQTVMRE
ncbi:TPA: hypothetical protein HA241_01785 [Candidatus Woesearchaeota archaeon]|nr:hypothetical protein [Candidatus Woesearchaeota archaeon]